MSPKILFTSDTENSIKNLDQFGDFLAKKYLIPKFDLEEKFALPPFDENGMLAIGKDGKLLRESEIITIGEYVKRCGY